MENEPTPQPQHLLIDWRIDALSDLTGVILSFLVLPMAEGPQEAKAMRPLGLGVEELRRLHTDLGELLELVDRGGSLGHAPPTQKQ